MILIEEVSCENKLELCKIEREFIEKNNSTLNSCIPCRTKKEWNKKYQKEKNKEYRNNNKDKIKEWRDNNKDKLKEYQKEYQKEWRDNNKDKIKEQKKEYYQNNKTKKNKYNIL